MVLIEDTTLREGEQSPGVVFSKEEKLAIAHMLADVGIRAMEVGTPAMGGAEEQAIRALVGTGLSARLIGWNRGRKEDLDRSFECGLQAVHIGLPSSDFHIQQKFRKSREWVIECMQELVSYARSQGAWVSVSAEDAGRAELGFLVHYARSVAEAGADRLRLSDTVGVLDPFRAYDIVCTLRENTSIPLQVHMHNDLGLATANTLAGVKAGAEHLHVTVNGLGERAGIAPLDEVVLGLRYHLEIETGLKTEGLVELAKFVAHASGRSIPLNKPVTGGAVFAHESGIHVDGILKAPGSFEPFPAELVGAQRQIVIGKHSGRGALRSFLTGHGLKASNDELNRLLEAVRQRAVEVKRCLEPAEVLDLLELTSAAGEEPSGRPS